MHSEKLDVRDFWNDASCGEQLLLPSTDLSGYREQSEKRYQLEPYISDFAAFAEMRDREVLEIGVGLGADHQRFAEAGARLTGIDLTPRAVEHTGRRFTLFGLKTELRVGDAEALPYADSSFDCVYSWGVLHHSPDTPRAIDEVHRVLRPGGKARIMIYHKHSLVGYMLWLRHALLVGRPWTSLEEIYAKHLESPGTKAYTLDAARKMFARYTSVEISTVLTHGDLLASEAGQRHRGWLLSTARRIWPRWFFRAAMPGHGLFMLIVATK